MGCAAIMETWTGVKANPSGFVKEVREELPPMNNTNPRDIAIAVGITSLANFLRKVYVNWRKGEAKKRNG